MSEHSDFLIAQYKAQFIHSEREWEQTRKWYGKGEHHWFKDLEGWVPVKPALNWDDNWDGKLVQCVEQLEEAGFEVTSFLRKRKIFMKLPKGRTKAGIVAAIETAIGSDWRAISFKPFAIWWGPNSNGRW